MSTYRAGNEQSRERIVALLLLLERAFVEKKPLTQDEIIRELKIDEYPVTSKNPKKILAYQGGDAAVRQKFERDKKAIREYGFDIETVILPDDSSGYQIDPSSGYAPVIYFTEEEQRVVRLALRFCGFGNSGAFSVFNEVPAGDGGLEYSAYIGPIIRAIRLRRVVSFEYQSSTKKMRTVEPLHTYSVDGSTYLVARVVGSGELKGYRISRMTSMPVVHAEGFEADDAIMALADAWRPQYQKVPTPIYVQVVTNANYAELLGRQYPAAIAANKGKGKVEVGLQFDDPHTALRFVLDGADRLRVVSPKSLVKELRVWLESVNRGDTPDLSTVSFSSVSASDVLGQTLQLLHAIYQAENGLRVSELATRFSMRPEDVRLIVGRLVTLEPMADSYDGPWRFPARIMKFCDDWENEDEDDSIYRAEYLDEADEPSALMWRDLFELNFALREASRLYDDPAIFSTIEKIEDVVSNFIRVEHSIDEPLLAEVNAAVRGREQIKITYVKGYEDVATERTIEPVDVRVLNGHSYVRAFCLTRNDWRTFRVDRITAIFAKSPALAPRDPDPVPNWLTEIADSGEEVVAIVDAGSRYLFEPLPGARWGTFGDNRHAVAFRVTSRDFLDHLMVLAGPGAVVATPSFAKAGHELAQRILDSL